MCIEYRRNEEEWRPAAGKMQNWNLLVSNRGRVMNAMTQHILKTHLNHNGYEVIRHLKVGNAFVHRAVYEAFRGLIPDGKEINHIDSNRTNNCLTNLEAVTRLQNVHHAIVRRTGRYPTASPDKPIRLSKRDRPRSNHLSAEIREGIRKLARTKALTYKEIAGIFGVHKCTVAKTVLGTTNWAKVPRRRKVVDAAS